MKNKLEDISTHVLEIRTIVIFGAVVSAMGLVRMSGSPAPVDPYCEMVKKGIDSNGEYGWPDYRGNYHTECPTPPRNWSVQHENTGG